MDEANVLMNAGVFLGETSEASLAIGVCEKPSGQPPQSRKEVQFSFYINLLQRLGKSYVRD